MGYSRFIILCILITILSVPVHSITVGECVNHYCDPMKRRCEANSGSACTGQYTLAGSPCYQVCERVSPNLEPEVLSSPFETQNTKSQWESPFQCMNFELSGRGCRYKDVACMQELVYYCMPSLRNQPIVESCPDGTVSDGIGNCIEPIIESSTSSILSKSGVFDGYVYDAYLDPMPYMRMYLDFGGETYETTTDIDGYYEFEVDGYDFSVDDPKQVVYTLDFLYLLDEKIYFYVADISKTPRPIQVRYGTEITKPGQTYREFDFNKTNPKFSSITPKTELSHFSMIYSYTHDAVDFTLNELDANIEYKLPVKIRAMGSEGTKYSPTNAIIHIDKTHSHMSSPNMPDNREYHEFAHHLMFSEYGDWPSGIYTPAGSLNHDGYINPSTADSFLEGFAEFMSCVIAEYNQIPFPDEYADYGSLDRNYVMWGWEGYVEEFAIAGILWDLYDAENEKGDSVTLELDEIWEVIRVKRTDLYDYYKAFIANHPEQKEGIDNIFRLHGAYHDTATGNSRWDPNEPFRNSDDNESYNLGEYYLDMYWKPGKNYYYLYYTPGDTIGKATNYHRPDRSMAVKLQNAYLKLDDTGPKYYQITINYGGGAHTDSESYVVQELEGKIYANPPPEYENWTIHITPYTYDFVSAQDYSITKEEYIKKYYSASNGFFDTHDFKLEKTGENKDPALKKIYGIEPAHQKNIPDEIGVDELTQNSKPTSLPCMPAISLIFGLLASLITKIMK